MLATVAGQTTGARRGVFDRRSLAGAAVMVGCGVGSVLGAHGTVSKIVVGVLMLAAEAGLIAARKSLSDRVAASAIGLTIVAGLAATVLAPNGLGEVPVLAGVASLPRYVPAGRVRTAAIGTVSVAFGVSIAVISHSWVGLMAGIGAWALADRSIEHAAFQSERDRALSLLAQVEASRDAQSAAAAAEERNRIAGEMHDVLAHSLAGLSMQLQAARAVAAREGAPASVTGPIDRAAELARDGLQEARAAVGALRATRLRGLDDLPGLVEDFPGDVRLEITGQPGRVGADAGHAVYRMVQEAMTNAARYATGSAVEVKVAWSAEQLLVLVDDDGVPAQRQPSGVTGSGTGIKTMTGRIEAAGGALSAGPDPDGPGWRVEARIPLTGRGGANGEVSA
jgi:signal transduction histidine kinase